jgi:hypothetical protein
MENNTCYNEYESLLKHHQGFLGIGMKLPVRDKNALSLVYTPGVGASCLEIQKDLTNAYKYTNKLNSMLLVTDSSGFENYDVNKWNNTAPIPYLEAMCVYYKLVANIDCYPLVFDHALITNGKDLAETVKAIMPAYAMIEFFGVSQQRIDEYNQAIGEHNDFGTLSLANKRQMEKTLRLRHLDVNINSLYAAVLRAAIDTQAYVNLNKVMESIQNYLINTEKCIVEKTDFYGGMKLLVHLAAEFILSHNLSHNKNKEHNLNQQELSLDYVDNKYRRFINEGDKAWIEVYPDNHLSKNATRNENSLLLHERYRGVIGTKSNIELSDPYK